MFPKYYDMLSKEDQDQYTGLRESLSSRWTKNRRGRRLECFTEVMWLIHAFCVRNTPDDWKRCLVCGLCWLSNGIAINNRHLSLLTGKCKSSINGSLQKIGYVVTRGNAEFYEKIPFIKTNMMEMKEWTVRELCLNYPQRPLEQPVFPVGHIEENICCVDDNSWIIPDDPWNGL